MTTRAHRGLGLAELVRLVTARACLVAGGDRVRIDVKIPQLRGVARLALAIRGARGLVHAVAVAAAARARVLGRLRGVTRRARLRIERRRAVRVVTRRARLIGVRAHGRRAALRARVAAHARLRRRRRDRERVAVETARRLGAGVQRCRLRRVARRAQAGRRRLKARVAVTRRARDLADVRGVTGAVLRHEVRGGHLLRHPQVAAAAGREHDRDRQHGDGSDHGRDPMA